MNPEGSAPSSSIIRNANDPRSWITTACCRSGWPVARRVSVRVRRRTSTVLGTQYNINPMTKIRPAELDDRLQSGSPPFVLDIRPRSNVQETAIENSHNIPVYSDLQSGDESALRDRLDEIPRDRDVVVVCKLGMVAKRATSVLDEEGYDAATLLGGISGWNGYRAGTLGYKIRSLRWKYL